MDARTVALSVLIACRRQGAWSEGALKEQLNKADLDKRDAAFASRLCYGVVQNRMLLDFYIDNYLTGNLKSLQPVVLDILRLGAYQILFMDKVPPSAAVNEAVEQCKRYANKKASGLVNGVLRTLSREKDRLPQPPDLATKYSHPQTLVELLRENVGDELLEPLLKANNEQVSTILQVNSLKADSEQVLKMLADSGVSLTPHPWLPDCFYAAGTGNLENLAAFREGLILVQDPAARLAATAAGVAPGMQVLDCCAAPGGKSFAAAAKMQNSGQIISCDLHEHKIALIQKGAERLGIQNLTAIQQDATRVREEFLEKFDAVLADVPCSGLGVIRKKPDIRYKDLAETKKLPEVQKKILSTVCRYVKPGGVLLYSTCTILKRENEAVAEDFLQNHPDFSLEPFAVPEKLTLENNGMATLLPCLHDTDGFFICKLRKKA